MKKFKDFVQKIDADIDVSDISDDVLIASTNYRGFAGVWTVGLASEATHNGQRLAGTPSCAEFSKTRSRNYIPSNKCLHEMIEHAEYLSK